MCGIVAALPSYAVEIVERPGTQEVRDALPSGIDLLGPDAPGELEGSLGTLNRMLDAAQLLLARAGTASVLAAAPSLRDEVADRAARIALQLEVLDARIDSSSGGWDAATTERIQSAVRDARDAVYGIQHDRLAAVERILQLMPSEAVADSRVMVGCLAVDRVLAALDRLEVRGRDSAGVSIWIGLDTADSAQVQQAALRLDADRSDPLLRTGSVRRFRGGIVFVYKRAAVVGALGDNVARIRAQIAADPLVHQALTAGSARVSVLAHTRWASVGRISEANAHPVDGEAGARLTLGVLNGDIDNHRALRRVLGLAEDDEVSTDAKLVPIVLGRHLAELPVPAAASAMLKDFDGSMAIAAQTSTSPDELVLAVKGSGQGLYVGVAPTGYMVASEVYGLVAEARTYLRLDGGRLGGASADGTIIRLRRESAGGPAGIERHDGDGRPAPVAPDDIRSAELTTRDLALGAASHYLEKEIGEASASLRKTLRSRIRPGGAGWTVDLPLSSMPATARSALVDGRIARVRIIGQGTAAVAAQGVAGLMESFCGSRLGIRAVPATEFSAYELEPDLSDMLVVAISQSGSTTDTNRSVDLARQRGAHVIAIINRRDSDLAAKSDGVLYTSDGRDVEMAVASTKAFYAQVAAGCLLGLQIGLLLGRVGADRADALLQSLLALPGQLDELYRGHHAIGDIAQETVTRHQNWSVVGSGPNRVAAAEARIKLSELCYRSVSTDAVEDKKHIDLSAESMVLLCAAGTPPGQLRDIKKEVEIFSAHRNVPIVITDTPADESWPTPWVIRVPATRPELAWILSTAAAHLFAYHAAASIDRCAAPLRIALAALEESVSGPGSSATPVVRAVVAEHVSAFVDRLESGEATGLLAPQTVAALTAAAAGAAVPPMGAPAVFTDYVMDPDGFLRASLSTAIDELSRSIDTVKHQAKTVTVGTSRDDAAHYANLIAVALADVGCDPAVSLSHPVLASISAHAAVTASVRGATRYRLRGTTAPEICIAARTGSSAALPSRAESWTPLVGSKELVARSRRPRLIRGAGDGRLVLVVPEQQGAVLSGVALVHLDLVDSSDGVTLLAALAATEGRVDELRAVVTEQGVDFDPDRLAELPVEQALLAPVDVVARSLARRTRVGWAIAVEAQQA